MKSFYEFYLQIQRENAAAGAAPAPAAGAAPAPAAGAAPAAPGAVGTAKPAAPTDPGIAALTKDPAALKVYQAALGQIKAPNLMPAAKSLLAALNPPK